MRQLFSLFLADNWLWMVLPVAVCSLLAYWIDVRWVLAALMLVMVVLPMVLALLYFYYGLSPEAVWSIKEKTVQINKQGLTLDFTDERMKTHVIACDDVRDIIEKGDAVVLMLRGRRYRCLMLPGSVVNPHVAQALRQLVAQAH